ncbi:SsgA family sporulation/cell division regulator [Streptomyces kaniharaensis]|uniref:SsgA family sporulation/cell division regulator n=1 Tax=Streptomyces kaniharaensis TaxID=212423 RepID=A0A6N7L4K0_9ACTN|nr:SsgA family sporulation/cell division regulator [Streptomyces kaniharaensis]MQS16793.1 SsgA family sporulation/cell division regulator [Streptomyces kaniharaensis]
MQMSAVRPVPVTFPDSALPDVPVDAELRFDTSLPYAACLAFPLAPCECTGRDAQVCWYFSRELLREGRCVPTGSGDVKVCPGSEGEVLITLRGPTGEAVLSAPEDAVTAFLSDSFALVPAGSESDHLDVDAALDRLLATD